MANFDQMPPAHCRSSGTPKILKNTSGGARKKGAQHLEILVGAKSQDNNLFAARVGTERYCGAGANAPGMGVKKSCNGGAKQASGKNKKKVHLN